jgi:hypothetical protein
MPLSLSRECEAAFEGNKQECLEVCTTFCDLLILPCVLGGERWYVTRMWKERERERERGRGRERESVRACESARVRE